MIVNNKIENIVMLCRFDEIEDFKAYWPKSGTKVVIDNIEGQKFDKICIKQVVTDKEYWC
jgi:mRNA-degrading endonuclease HigB of HigAB toxin-antitoxin module